jgi:hypothetical protein
MLGLGYGFKPWLSGYVFQPYNLKRDEPGGLDSRGFTDLSLMAVLGFKYDGRFMLVPASESLDDLLDWHFTTSAGVTLPTGDANHRIRDGVIDPGKALGFGKPAFNYGLAASKQLSENATVVFEGSRIQFQEYRYDDGHSMRFGAESRLNAALAYRLITDPARKFRLDVDSEINLLQIQRDRRNGIDAPGSGGKIAYGVLGVRLYKDNLSLALALKKPYWTGLNEASQQQGSEGREKYRLIMTISSLY